MYIYNILKFVKFPKDSGMVPVKPLPDIFLFILQNMIFFFFNNYK